MADEPTQYHPIPPVTSWLLIATSCMLCELNFKVSCCSIDSRSSILPKWYFHFHTGTSCGSKLYNSELVKQKTEKYLHDFIYNRLKTMGLPDSFLYDSMHTLNPFLATNDQNWSIVDQNCRLVIQVLSLREIQKMNHGVGGEAQIFFFQECWGSRLSFPYAKSIVSFIFFLWVPGLSKSAFLPGTTINSGIALRNITQVKLLWTGQFRIHPQD